jgi:hypothetical protein
VHPLEAMSGPTEISNGRETVKIYGLSIRGKAFHQIAYYRAGRRERRNFVELACARIQVAEAATLH